MFTANPDCYGLTLSMIAEAMIHDLIMTCVLYESSKFHRSNYTEIEIDYILLYCRHFVSNNDANELLMRSL